jgi:hypothetical protein
MFWSFYEKLSFHGMFEKSIWRTWCYLSIKVWKQEVWVRLCMKRLRSLICIHSKSKGSWSCLHNETIGAELASIMKVKELKLPPIMILCMTWVYEKFCWCFTRYFMLNVLIYLWILMGNNIFIFLFN